MNHAWSHAAFVSVSVVALAACSPQAKQDTGNVVNAAENSISNAANATGNAIQNAGQALTPTPTAQEFIDKAARSDAFEIAAAKLAKTNAASADVKDFAKMMIDAHTQSTARIKKVAGGLSPALTPDPTLTDSQKGKLDDLGKLKGADFDKKYIEGQVDAHEDALALMKKYAADGEEPALKSAAGDIEPVVQTHLDKAKALKDKQS